MNLALWKKLLVVVPALIIVHLTATGMLPLMEGFREYWELGPGQDVHLGAAFPIGYAAAVPFALLLRGKNLRAALSLSVLATIIAAAIFAIYVAGYGLAMVCIVALGAAAGIGTVASARLLGLAAAPLQALVMALLIVVAWYISVPFFDFFKQGLPIGGAAGWAGPYMVQAVLALVWFPLVLFTIPSRPPGRFRQ